MKTNPNTVVKRNELLNASYRLTANEQTLLTAIISTLDSMDELTDQKFYTLHASQLDEATGNRLTKSAIYKIFRSSLDRLFDRAITVETPISGGRLKFRWIQSAQYNEKQGSISVRFSTDILPYLSNISGNFTKYKIKHVSEFKSAYSLRFYEWFVDSRYLKKGERFMTVSQIRILLDLEDKYPSAGDLKAAVIDPSLKEINKKSNIHITYKQFKRGKYITHFIFKIKQITPEQRVRRKTPVVSTDQSHQHYTPVASGNRTDYGTRKISDILADLKPETKK